MKETEELDLSKLPVGKRGKVVSLQAEGLTRSRLLDLGLIPETVVEVIRQSPAGDPIAYGIRGAIIALRSEVSSLITIHPL
ncbi:MAG TPA: ferrous iron transport protein A [Firmicutes bacterium]|jgi:ferrous iron transport protein A|nr:ferrous iron transport protein A [Bacillota bacterium]HBT16610.1 ferrous iron transport protein A [Bacillota bacterium]